MVKPNNTNTLRGGGVAESPLGATVLAPIKRLRKNFAFTLAEVLITLGIVGIVAAMVIPSLITSIRATQYATKYKKMLASLSNAGRISLAQYGFDYSGLNSSCGSAGGSHTPDSKQSICAIFNATLNTLDYKYANRNDLTTPSGQHYTPRNDGILGADSMTGNTPMYTLADGTLIILSRSLGNYICTGSSIEEVYFQRGSRSNLGSGCVGVIDVNGTAPPNKVVKCTKGRNVLPRKSNSPAFNCVVDRKDVTDIYPFIIHDGIAEPLSDAAVYVFNNIK